MQQQAESASGDTDLWRSASHQPDANSSFEVRACSLPHRWWWWKGFKLVSTEKSWPKYKLLNVTVPATSPLFHLYNLLPLFPNNSHTSHTVNRTPSMPTLDAITPPKPSSLPSDIVKQLLINLDDKVDQLKSSKEGLDMEGLLAFQRVANYLWVGMP